MKKTMYLFYIVDIVLFILLAGVQIRLWGSFEYPRQAELISFLINCRSSLLSAFFVCVITTAALRWSFREVNEEISFLKYRISELEKKLKDK
ncbi:MAG: hypothetical protein U0L92_02085 [Clostridia bacterium]|nr:hypothetical protein [Clostridia bacterium]